MMMMTMMTMMVLVVRQLKATNGNTITLPQYIEFGISSQLFPLNSNYIFSNSTKSNGFPPSNFKSNVSRRRLLAPTIGNRRRWTLWEFSRRLAAPVVLVLSVGFVEHTCTPSKIPCTIAEFRTTSKWTLTLIQLSKLSKWRHRL